MSVGLLGVGGGDLGDGGGVRGFATDGVDGMEGRTMIELAVGLFLWNLSALMKLQVGQ